MLYTNILTLLAMASLATGAALGTPPNQLSRSLNQTVDKPAADLPIPLLAEDGKNKLDAHALSHSSESNDDSANIHGRSFLPSGGRKSAGSNLKPVNPRNGPAARNPLNTPVNATGNSIGSTDPSSISGGFSVNGSGSPVVFKSNGYSYYPGGAYFPYHNYGPGEDNNVKSGGTNVTPFGPVNLTNIFPGDWLTGSGHAYKLLQSWTFTNKTTGKKQTIQVIAVCDDAQPCAAGGFSIVKTNRKFQATVMPDSSWAGLDHSLMVPTTFKDKPTLLLNASVAGGTTAKSAAVPLVNAKSMYPAIGAVVIVAALANVV